MQLARVSSKDTLPGGPKPMRGRDEIQPLLMSCGRKVKFNAIGGIGLLCCCGVKVGKRVLVRRLLIEDPQGLARDSVTFGRDAVAVVKHENRGCGWFRCG